MREMSSNFLVGELMILQYLIHMIISSFMLCWIGYTWLELLPLTGRKHQVCLIKSKQIFAWSSYHILKEWFIVLIYSCFFLFSPNWSSVFIVPKFWEHQSSATTSMVGNHIKSGNPSHVQLEAPNTKIFQSRSFLLALNQKAAASTRNSLACIFTVGRWFCQIFLLLWSICSQNFQITTSQNVKRLIWLLHCLCICR